MPARIVFTLPDGEREERRRAEIARAAGAFMVASGGRTPAGLVHASYLNGPSLRRVCGGSFLEFRHPSHGPERRPGVRGKVTSFSRASRWRLRKFLALLRRDVAPSFVTLTYPAAWSFEPTSWKEHFHALSVAMARDFPQLSAVWKLEFQERGAPHFHLFLYGLSEKGWSFPGPGVAIRRGTAPSRQEFRRWVSQRWAEIVNSGDERHFRAGTRVERIRSPQGVQSYAAGYASKSDQTLQGVEVGRYWGAIAREKLPLCEVETVAVDPEGMKAVERTARRFMQARRVSGWRRARERGATGPKPRPRAGGSFTLLCDADAWAKRIPAIVEGRRWFLAQRAAAGSPSLAGAVRDGPEGRAAPKHTPRGPDCQAKRAPQGHPSTGATLNNPPAAGGRFPDSWAARCRRVARERLETLAEAARQL